MPLSFTTFNIHLLWELFCLWRQGKGHSCRFSLEDTEDNAEKKCRVITSVSLSRHSGWVLEVLASPRCDPIATDPFSTASARRWTASPQWLTMGLGCKAIRQACFKLNSPMSSEVAACTYTDGHMSYGGYRASIMVQISSNAGKFHG